MKNDTGSLPSVANLFFNFILVYEQFLEARLLNALDCAATLGKCKMSTLNRVAVCRPRGSAFK